MLRKPELNKVSHISFNQRYCRKIKLNKLYLFRILAPPVLNCFPIVLREATMVLNHRRNLLHHLSHCLASFANPPIGWFDILEELR